MGKNKEWKVEVVWDTDGEEISELPKELTLPSDIDPDDIADRLSDEYGFCVESLTVTDTETGERV